MSVSRLSAPSCIADESGKLHMHVVRLLSFLSGVDQSMISDCRVRPDRANWLHAPWYPCKRGGGGITIGRTIFMTRNFFTPVDSAPVRWRHKARGDDQPEAVYRWLRLLSHEVGHLPQMHSYGMHLTGKVRYVGVFFLGYLFRTLLFRWPVHDGLGLEVVADKGCWVFDTLISITLQDHPGAVHEVVDAVIRGDEPALSSWMEKYAEDCSLLLQQYEETNCKAFGTC